MAASVSILTNSAAVSNTKDSRFCATQDKTIITIIITKDPRGLSFPERPNLERGKSRTIIVVATISLYFNLIAFSRSREKQQIRKMALRIHNNRKVC